MLLRGPLFPGSPANSVGQDDASRDPAISENAFLGISSNTAGMNNFPPNPEWNNHPSAPASGQPAVPSLADAGGYFFAAARNVWLLTHRQMIAIQGLQSMRRPAG
jgi:hypothetical protein